MLIYDRSKLFQFKFDLMQALKQPLQHQSSSQILNLMKESRIYWQARKQVISLILKTKASSLNNNNKTQHQDIVRHLSLTGNDQKINGLINNCLQKSTRRIPIEKDSHPEIQTYRVKWSEIIVKEFNNISSKIVREEEYDEEDESVSYIYDSSSFLEFLSSIKIKTACTVRDSAIFLFPTDVIKVLKYSQIKSKYNFLNSMDNIVGSEMDNDLRDREKKGKKIADGENISSEIENYLCYGSANGQRVSVYNRYFECFYQHIAKKVEFGLYQKIWKQIIKSDSKEILKDPFYFVFKQEIIKTYQIFITDKQLTQMIKIRQLAPIETKLDKYSPIHSTLPCKSFATYISLFCYTSTCHEEIYEIFREIYSNYFILLNTISSVPDSILGLCILFEELLWTTEKKIVSKLEDLHIQPLRIVFPWIFYCFIGYIDTEQIFLLLDRIIGSKSLEILPLYCVSMFFKAKTQILEANSQTEVQEILENSLKEDIFIETIREFFKYHL